VKFIVFEGLDGCGKSTQQRLLAKKLNERNIPHITTRQPSDNPIGTLTRTTTDGILRIENESMALLLAADRYQHTYDEIAPALEEGKYVLCDRFYYSSFAFQGIDPGMFARIAAYNALVMSFCKPDVTFFIDVTPDECMRRITLSRKEKGLYESLSQLETVRERYLTIFNELKNTENIVFINGNADEETVAAEIFAYLQINE
jgi:dTMP kinase